MTKEEAIKVIEEYIADADKAISMDKEYVHGWKSALLVALVIVYGIEDHMNHDLISRKALLEAYDKAHKGPPGGARKLIEEAPGYGDIPQQTVWSVWDANKQKFIKGVNT